MTDPASNGPLSQKPYATVRYWAAARAAAGVAHEQLPGSTVAELLAQALVRHPALAPVLAKSSLLLDGLAVHDRSEAINDGVTLEVLPPFAGG